MRIEINEHNGLIIVLFIVLVLASWISKDSRLKTTLSAHGLDEYGSGLSFWDFRRFSVVKLTEVAVSTNWHSFKRGLGLL